MPAELLPQTAIRHIKLERQQDGHYQWTCTECGWISPLFDPNDYSATPMQAIEEFAKHSCVKPAS